MNPFHKTVERGAEDAELVLVLDGQAFGQVAFTVGDVFHGAGHDVQRLDQDADQHAEQGDNDRHGNDGRDDRRGAELTEHGEGFALVHGEADVPVDRGQPFDWGKRHDAGFAVNLDFARLIADDWRVLRVDVLEGFHHQRFVRVNQDLAVGTDQEA